MEEKIIESFTLDHDKVLAPYVRVIETQYSKHGDPLTNYDVRLVAPNVQEIPTAAMHTLEHLLAKYLRKSWMDISIVLLMDAERDFICSAGEKPILIRRPAP